MAVTLFVNTLSSIGSFDAYVGGQLRCDLISYLAVSAVRPTFSAHSLDSSLCCLCCRKRFEDHGRNLVGQRSHADSWTLAVHFECAGVLCLGYFDLGGRAGPSGSGERGPSQLAERHVGLLHLIFFTEWGDPGQIAAAALVLKSHMLLATWIGATLALMTKGAPALTLGVQLRNRLSQRMLRIVASGSCCALGILAIARA
jgi:hypothetical protein